ncbi:MAG: nucleoside-triphosphatase [Clostridium sp.]
MDIIGITNIFITGKKGIGKSYLLGKVIEALGIVPSGYRTLPYFHVQERKGFYMHGLVELDEKENDKIISIQNDAVSCIPVIETFQTLGVKILKKSMESNNVILLDELGRLERNSKEFLNEIQVILDSDRTVIGVLKKEEIAYIEEIIKRDDTLVFDLDIQKQDYIYNEIVKELTKMIP